MSLIFVFGKRVLSMRTVVFVCLCVFKILIDQIQKIVFSLLKKVWIYFKECVLLRLRLSWDKPSWYLNIYICQFNFGSEKKRKKTERNITTSEKTEQNKIKLHFQNIKIAIGNNFMMHLIICIIHMVHLFRSHNS